MRNTTRDSPHSGCPRRGNFDKSLQTEANWGYICVSVEGRPCLHLTFNIVDDGCTFIRGYTSDMTSIDMAAHDG